MTRNEYLKHKALIQAWGDGQDIQFKMPAELGWRDCSSDPLWDETVEYRVAPIKKQVRMALYRNLHDGKENVIVCHGEKDIKEAETRQCFIRWLTPTILY